MAKKKRRAQIDTLGPTPEQLDRGVFTIGGLIDKSAAFTYRRTPVIDTMAQTGKLTARQHYGLSRYRDVATATERSPMRDSLDKALYGRSGGQGAPLSGTRAKQELDRLEGALGSLYPIAHAIAIDDQSVSQWAMRQGAIERQKTLREKVITWFEPRRKAQQLAMVDIKMAGERLAAAIGG